MNHQVYKTLLVFSLICIFNVYSQYSTLTIPLNKTVIGNNKELYGEFINLNGSSTLQVNFSNVNTELSFIIFQVHSHIYNVTLYNNSLVRGSYVNGTNVGLYSAVTPALDVMYIYNPNEFLDLKLYVSVHGYGVKDPIPGGCNMEFPVAVSPYLRTVYNKHYVMLDAAAPKKYNDKTCSSMDVITVFYRMYLPEKDLTADTYFEGIKKMMTLEQIELHGDVIPMTATIWNMRRMLSAYPGTGSVYVAVACSTTACSVYVPTYTYACSPLDGDCDVFNDFLSRLICAILFFVGIFICYFGHRFFKTEMFLVGMACGVVCTYIVISLIADLDQPALIGASILSGLFFGGIWLVFWCFYGIPVFAVLLSTLSLGFLVSGIIYYGLPDGLMALQLDFNFWTLFILIMLLTSLMLVSMTLLSNILCCCILGAYAALYPIDYYIGSNLKYIMINVIRRATVPKFNRAVISPPFEWNDVLITFLWVALATTGFILQHYHNRGRPPFPPPPRMVSPWLPDASIYTNPQRWYGAAPQTQTPSAPYQSPARNSSERTPLLA